MPELMWVPPKVKRELQEQTRQYAADLEKVCSQDATCREWTRELSRLDPALSMVRAPDKPVLGLPLVAGAYHILNRGRYDAPPSVIPVTDPDGRPCPPPGRLLDQLKSQDLQNPSVERMRDRIQRETQAATERAQERAREERQVEILERWKASDRAFVSMDTSTPWHQNAAGRRGAKKKD